MASAVMQEVGVSDDLGRFLRSVTGAGDALRITVTADDGAPILHEFSYPYVLIGRGEGCQILLPDPLVSFRHAYFQVIEGRVFCVDLASRNGVLWPDGPRKYGWIEPGVPIQIGRHTLEVMGDLTQDQALRDALADLNPLERYRAQAGPMPKVDLEFRYETSGSPTWSVNRLLTLVGRSALCKLRFDTNQVSAVHCGLLLTRQGLWAIDLLGRGGTKVDGQDIRAVPLESGNEISVGEFQIGVFYEESLDVDLEERLTDNAAESETSMDDLESPYLKDSPMPETALLPPQQTPPKPTSLEWFGTIFQAQADGDTLIVIPMVDGCGFRYQQLHIEANSLQRILETQSFKNLVVDLQNLNYFGSELIGALIRLARTVTDDKGKAAFCAPSPRMLEVLEGMRLNKLWPIVASRNDAMKHIKP
jgi:anti-anti-sigma factor